MKLSRQGRKRFIAAAVAMMFAAGIGVAVAATSGPPSNAVSMGKGINEFGMTKAYFKGKTVDFTYSRGFFCDTSIPAASTSGCEVGAKFKHLPPRTGPNGFDPLYIAVPLGFTVPRHSMECPSGLVCVDHPGTVDMTRLEPALKPLYPSLTNAQLTDALKNFATPGHSHFITTRDQGKREWWDIRVVGVTNKKVYNQIIAHRSTAYLLKQVKAGRTTPVIRSNIFLFFSVQ